MLKDNRGLGSAARQADALRHEGVEVQQDAMGDYYIDMHRFGWFPSRLPSEEGETDDSEGEGEGEGEGEDGELFV